MMMMMMMMMMMSMIMSTEGANTLSGFPMYNIVRRRCPPSLPFPISVRLSVPQPSFCRNSLWEGTMNCSNERERDRQRERERERKERREREIERRKDVDTHSKEKPNACVRCEVESFACRHCYCHGLSPTTTTTTPGGTTIPSSALLPPRTTGVCSLCSPYYIRKTGITHHHRDRAARPCSC
uniref:Putative secreted protein n=1 Tax=Anopheles darlingi TaxID=43151 RepID=A0A2M4D9L5_ANODA